MFFSSPQWQARKSISVILTICFGAATHLFSYITIERGSACINCSHLLNTKLFFLSSTVGILSWSSREQYDRNGLKAKNASGTSSRSSAMMKELCLSSQTANDDETATSSEAAAMFHRSLSKANSSPFSSNSSSSSSRDMSRYVAAIRDETKGFGLKSRTWRQYQVCSWAPAQIPWHNPFPLS